MVRSRTLTALLGLAGSLLVSALLWWYFDSLVFFLFLPFVPFLFRGATAAGATRRCQTCGFRTDDEAYEYCPRDGTELE
ncbi:hypothetical protein [Haloprofundus sp. MHR1]|uniref:hypothetical protein n=1 Tax=Haloprofundus sp. MHR1 TaxID=2572921 RepID=UPI0010BE75BB|nr:hypothetical protein [Haloprofundus sp. MHR1]QCJ47924.1 hypothetical protein FCF25_12715 [Haloprofundus sp. MHR1]